MAESEPLKGDAMLVSELIEQLEARLKTHGDMTVELASWGMEEPPTPGWDRKVRFDIYGPPEPVMILN